LSSHCSFFTCCQPFRDFIVWWWFCIPSIKNSMWKTGCVQIFQKANPTQFSDHTIPILKPCIINHLPSPCKLFKLQYMQRVAQGTEK
jgi:hypothetical protein